MSCPSYPGIIEIGYLKADILPANTTYNALAGVPIVLFVRPTVVPLSSNASLEVEQTNERNGTVESLTLTFRSATRLPRHCAVAFVIRTANGQYYLIGQSERLYLAITATQMTGTPDGDPAVYQYEVKHTASIVLKPCNNDGVKATA